MTFDILSITLQVT